MEMYVLEVFDQLLKSLNLPADSFLNGIPVLLPNPKFLHNRKISLLLRLLTIFEIPILLEYTNISLAVSVS